MVLYFLNRLWKQTYVKSEECDTESNEGGLMVLNTESNLIVTDNQGNLSTYNPAKDTFTTNKLTVNTTSNTTDAICIGNECITELDLKLPIGTILPFAGLTVPNSSFLLCDGAAISRTTYSKLFVIIGTTYGVGDNSTTFNLPDFRSRFGLGAGAGTGLTNRQIGVKGGTENETLTINQMPSHNHTGTALSAGNHSHTTDIGSVVQSAGSYTTNDWTYRTNKSSGFQTSSTNGEHTHALSINNTGGDQAHNNMPPFITINYIIKVL